MNWWRSFLATLCSMCHQISHILPILFSIYMQNILEYLYFSNCWTTLGLRQKERFISIYYSILYVILSKYSKGGRFYEMASVWIHVKWWRGKWEDIPCLNNQLLGQLLEKKKKKKGPLLFCFVWWFFMWIDTLYSVYMYMTVAKEMGGHSMYGAAIFGSRGQ